MNLSYFHVFSVNCYDATNAASNHLQQSNRINNNSNVLKLKPLDLTAEITPNVYLTAQILPTFYIHISIFYGARLRFLCP